MIKHLRSLLAIALGVIACGRQPENIPTPEPEYNPLTLHYDKPAKYFEEALPLGNGTMGAMVYGRTGKDRISLNDITLWTGEPDRGPEHPDYLDSVKTLTPWGQSAQWIETIRDALNEENYKRADSLQHRVQGHYSETYQPLGWLEIDYPYGKIGNYKRQLDISNATAEVTYQRGGANFKAEYFVSAPDSVIAIRLTSDAPIEATLRLQSLLPHQDSLSDGRLISDGYAAWHAFPGYYKSGKEQFCYNPERGVHYRTVVSCQGAIPEEGALRITGVKEALILITGHTSFNGFDKDPVLEGREYKESAIKNADDAAEKGWDVLKERHTADYKALFDRVSLDLGTTPPEISNLPTDKQLLRYADGEANPQLEALYYQYGRYLLISCSRTPGVPANLQGLWNESMDPPWSSNYTTNINLEENYWAAEAAALPEMHQSLLGFIGNLSQTGGRSAQNYYGVQEGWCLAQNTDIWAMTCPVGLGVGDPEWANWNMGGAWLATHIWEHWLFTRSLPDLQRDYPALKGAAQFCLNVLLERNGELITSPSTSPENIYQTPTGYKGATAYGITADLAIIRECLIDALLAAELMEDEDFAAEVGDVLPFLRYYKVGANGAIQEWYHDWPDPYPTHRHQSHLIGAYPGHQIKAGTPLAQAALKTLEIRGFKTTGWSCGWRVNLYARLGDAENAYKMYRQLLKYVSPDKYEGRNARRGGGTYPNLLDAHSPFQIDGNFGGCAGVMEMLLYSTPTSVTPLPALPKAWPNGSIKGIRTRTGERVDLTWENGEVKEFTCRPDDTPRPMRP